MADTEFELEPSIEPGMVPPRVIDELRQCYRDAKDYAGAFADAIKAQGQRHKVRPAALRRYVAALEGDTVDKVAAEAADLERLIDAGQT